MKTLIDGYTCNRPTCGHTWTPRTVPRETEPPKICPKCKSKRWDDPRVVLVFAVAEWDFAAREQLGRQVYGGPYRRVTSVDQVLAYGTADSRTLVLFTSNWYVQERESAIPVVLTERGYTCETEVEFMRRAVR